MNFQVNHRKLFDLPISHNIEKNYPIGLFYGLVRVQKNYFH